MKPDERKSVLFAFRVEAFEVEVIEEAIAISGLNKSDWIRDTLMREAEREIDASRSKKPSSLI